MFIDPNIGESINIDGKAYKFTEASNAPGILYAEIGRKAKVYRVISSKQYFALKAFKPKYRTSETIENTNRISRYQDVSGLAVAKRTVIAPENHLDLVKDNGAFAYAVIMPWVDGKSWFNYVTGKISINKRQSLRLAHSLVGAISELEQLELAHCDLSSSNFIFSSDFAHVELIDIEDMFGHNLLAPKEKSKGTPGYAPAWIKENGAWEAGGDRFCLGILVGEILGWQFEEIREASAGDAYFADGEFCNKTKRFRLLSQRMKQIHPELSNLFKTVWYAESLEECPKASDWKRVLDSIQEPTPEFYLSTETGDEIPLDKEKMIIGRNDIKNEIQVEIDLSTLDSKRIISRQHASIEREGNTFFIKDLQSKNHTKLNGNLLNPGQGYALQDGDLIVLGKKGVKLTFLSK